MLILEKLSSTCQFSRPLLFLAAPTSERPSTIRSRQKIFHSFWVAADISPLRSSKVNKTSVGLRLNSAIIAFKYCHQNEIYIVSLKPDTVAITKEGTALITDFTESASSTTGQLCFYVTDPVRFGEKG